MKEKEINGKIIFDKNGKAIGISTSDASLDFRLHEEKIIIVIKPKEKNEKKK